MDFRIEDILSGTINGIAKEKLQEIIVEVVESTEVRLSEEK